MLNRNKMLNKNNLPPPSHSVESNNLFLASGMLPIDLKTGQLKEGTIVDRTHQTIHNIKLIAKNAGCTLKNIVSMTVYLTDFRDFKKFNSAYFEHFEQSFPIDKVYKVNFLPLGADIEIDVIFEKQP